TPAALARAFTTAWTGHDYDAAAAYVADDVAFDGPMNHLRGKAAYMESLSGFARAVTGVEIIAAFGDDTRALVLYDLATAPFGVMATAELLTFRDGKIVADRLTSDTYPMRRAAAGQPPAAPGEPA
ncbi:MAG TPA: nuclear transport factor 2 family protein, partial [Thermomicrobiales bacterium]|nr:nuclear transport factor 2 family protein [Thermomicrobiales bacterium]